MNCCISHVVSLELGHRSGSPVGDPEAVGYQRKPFSRPLRWRHEDSDSPEIGAGLSRNGTILADLGVQVIGHPS